MVSYGYSHFLVIFFVSHLFCVNNGNKNLIHKKYLKKLCADSKNLPMSAKNTTFAYKKIFAGTCLDKIHERKNEKEEYDSLGS